MNRFCIKALATVVAILSAAAAPVHDAHAWGSQGHRLTALIAEQLLTPSARSQVREILGSTDLVGAALYLDVHKDALEQMIAGSRDWHYDDRPMCRSDVPRSEYCLGGNCASVQIKRYFNMLMDPEISKPRKRFAVRVLAHLAGDIHQPLHASNHDDAGGNAIKLTGSWNASANLHSVWDNDFVRRAFSVAEFSNKTERQIASLLAQQITDAEKESWPKGPVIAWLGETYGKAVDVAYAQLPGFACSESDFEAKPITLTSDYIDKAVAIIPEQLKKGGVRLAAMLNRALSAPTETSNVLVRAGKL